MATKTFKENLKDASKDAGVSIQNTVNSAGPYFLAFTATAAGLDHAIDSIGAALDSPQWLDTVTFYAGLGLLTKNVLRPVQDDGLNNYVRSMGNVIHRKFTKSKKYKFKHDTPKQLESKRNQIKTNTKKRNVRSGLVMGGLAALLALSPTRDHSRYAWQKITGDVATLAEGLEDILDGDYVIPEVSNTNYNKTFAKIPANSLFLLTR